MIKHISIKTGTQSRLVRDEDDDKDSDDERISFTGVRSSARDRLEVWLNEYLIHKLNKCLNSRELQRNELANEDNSDEEKETWEEMQIRKAMKGAKLESFVSLPVPEDRSSSHVPQTSSDLPKPASYNLEGIKARLKDRYTY